jgi:threonine/homoserine/homoserine lactone efflux protein
VIPSFLTGLAAGYGIAVPVGAIAVLIIQLGIRRGFRTAAAAGLGAAAADFTYGLLAAIFGTAIAGLIDPIAVPLGWVSVVALLAIALYGLWSVRRSGAEAAATRAEEAAGRSLRPTFLRFYGLTMLNPVTVTYFAALILGLPAAGLASGAAERLAFVGGVALASASWQLVLAGAAGILHRRADERVQVATAILGNLIVLGFGVRIALDLAA